MRSVIGACQKNRNEATDNTHFRLSSNKMLKPISEQQLLERKLRVLDECSKDDHETTWKQIRKLGNTLLFSRDLAYQNWKVATESATLLYFGKLGCRKSVAMANIVDDLTISAEPALLQWCTSLFDRTCLRASNLG